MLTGTLLSYRLSRWKLVLLYLALIPLAAFVLFELHNRLSGEHGWFVGIVAVTTLMGGLEYSRKWSRFVTELHCTEVGIHVTMVFGGNRDIAWARIKRLRRIQELGSRVDSAELAALETEGEPPLYLYMGKETRGKLLSLLNDLSEAQVTGFEDPLPVVSDEE